MPKSMLLLARGASACGFTLWCFEVHCFLCCLAECFPQKEGWNIMCYCGVSDISVFRTLWPQDRSSWTTTLNNPLLYLAAVANAKRWELWFDFSEKFGCSEYHVLKKEILNSDCVARNTGLINLFEKLSYKLQIFPQNCCFPFRGFSSLKRGPVTSLSDLIRGTAQIAQFWRVQPMVR